MGRRNVSIRPEVLRQTRNRGGGTGGGERSYIGVHMWPRSKWYVSPRAEQEGVVLASPSSPASVIWELWVSDGRATIWNLTHMGLWHEGDAHFDCLKTLRFGCLSVTQLMLISLTTPTINSHSWVMFGGCLSEVKSGASLGKSKNPRVEQQMVNSSISHDSLSTND